MATTTASTKRQSLSTELYVSQRSLNESWDENVMTSRFRMRSYPYVYPDDFSEMAMGLMCRGILDIASKEKIILQ